MADEKNWKQEKKEKKQEMSLDEARAYRAALHKEQPAILDESQKREQFRLYWAENKSKYGKAKDLEDILWVHLQSAKLSDPENFEKGLAHFGLKKIR